MLDKEFRGNSTEIYSLATRGDECKEVVVLKKSFEDCKISTKISSVFRTSLPVFKFLVVYLQNILR